MPEHRGDIPRSQPSIHPGTDPRASRNTADKSGIRTIGFSQPDYELENCGLVTSCRDGLRRGWRTSRTAIPSSFAPDRALQRPPMPSLPVLDPNRQARDGYPRYCRFDQEQARPPSTSPRYQLGHNWPLVPSPLRRPAVHQDAPVSRPTSAGKGALRSPACSRSEYGNAPRGEYRGQGWSGEAAAAPEFVYCDAVLRRTWNRKAFGLNTGFYALAEGERWLPLIIASLK